MTERPILFAAPMVRAILAGTKTQTRRVCKAATDEDGTEFRDADGWPMRDDSGCGEVRAACPYGAPGDRLWVRETWHASPHFGCLYRADYDDGAVLPKVVAHGGWKPSIFMPRPLSRITLEITSVRVERLQDISEADAKAEGVHADGRCRQDDDTAAFSRIGPVRDNSFPVARYAALWESINGPGSWDANPWVWAISFRRLP